MGMSDSRTRPIKPFGIPWRIAICRFLVVWEIVDLFTQRIGELALGTPEPAINDLHIFEHSRDTLLVVKFVAW